VASDPSQQDINEEHTLNARQSQRLLALIIVGLATAVAAPQVLAQAQDASKTRREVRVDLREFMKTHVWDESSGMWLPDDNAPKGSIMSRREFRDRMHDFLASNRWDSRNDRWVPLTPRRRLSTLTREQVQAETRAFLQTHHWDEEVGDWVLNPPAEGQPRR
jgi:hypothetical protein